VHITVLGSGTSHGMPMIGCHCPVCSSTDPRNRRLRTGAAVDLGGHTLLIDTTPDLRQQALTHRLERVDAVAFTHGHADHVMGFDELRRFAELNRRGLPVYAAPSALVHLQRIFRYAMTDDRFGLFGIPVVEWRPFEGPVDLWGHRLTPVFVSHGVHAAVGIRIDAPDGASMAWCPDCSGLAAASRAALRGLDILFIDGLRHRPHPTHFTVAEAVETIRDLAPARAFLIHMTHDLDHAETEASLPALPEVPGGIRLAYDGLALDVSPTRRA
jgi:phosphoribosyl 1,2-cyclic phosphate phosphodiesterase